MNLLCELNDNIILGLDGMSHKPPRLTARAIVKNQDGLYMEFRFKKRTAINKEKPFQNVKTASFLSENWRFWSGLRDLNPRSPGPKPGAIPNFAKPGYSFGVSGDVVKGYFRPEQGRSQEEKVLVLQRVFGPALFHGGSRCSSSQK